MIATLAVAVAVVTAQSGDLVTFVRMMLTLGVEAEANPIVALGFSTVGLAPLVVAKIALMVLIVTIFHVLARAHRRTAAVVATAAVAAGVLGTFTNLLAMA
jgi:hypothetical protein